MKVQKNMWLFFIFRFRFDVTNVLLLEMRYFEIRKIRRILQISPSIAESWNDWFELGSVGNCEVRTEEQNL